MLTNTSLLGGTAISYSTELNFSSTQLYINTSGNYTTDSDHSNTTESYFFMADFQQYQSILDTLEIIRLCVCIVGIILNILSILAVLHVRREINNHLKLILSLAVSDGLVLITILIFYNILLKTSNDSSKYYLMVARQLVNTFVYATLTNLVGMAVEHFIAIMIPLRYPIYMSNVRSNCMIVFIWLVSVFVGFIDKIIMCFIKDEDESVWDAVISHQITSELIVISFMPVVCIVLTIIYLRIYCVVRALVRNQPSVNTFEAQNYKAIITTFLILGTFILCWLPYFTYQVIMYCLIHSDEDHVWNNFHKFQIINDILLIVLLSNCVCDPIIYAVRIGQVQQGFKRMFHKICTFFHCLMPQREFHLLLKAPRSRRQTEATILQDNVSRNGRDSITGRNDSLTPISTVYVSEEMDLKINPVQSDKLQEKTNNNADKVIRVVHNDDSIDDIVSDNQNRLENDVKNESEIADREDRQSINSRGTILTQTSPVSNKDFWPENETLSLM